MYAKVKENVLLKYPYEFKDFIEENPYTSSYENLYIAFQNTDANLRGEILVQVEFLEKPNFDEKFQNAIQDVEPSYVNDKWVIGWNVIEKTSQELADQDATKAHDVRQKRNKLLFDSDWTQGKDIPEPVSTTWATYRQALRDITIQAGFPWDVTWPVEP